MASLLRSRGDLFFFMEIQSYIDSAAGMFCIMAYVRLNEPTTKPLNLELTWLHNSENEVC